MPEPIQTPASGRGGQVGRVTPCAPSDALLCACGAHGVTRPTTSGGGSSFRAPRRFEFERDSFAFANELHWEYRFEATTGRTTSSRRDEKPAYAHRCFVLTRAARQFLYHARFDPEQPVADDETYQRLICEVMSRNPRTPCARSEVVAIPGYDGLRQFSRSREALLKSECGGAWQSYVLRSHWRMVFPITRLHQERTADGLLNEIRRGGSPIVHLVRFPKLTINHGMVLFDVEETKDGILFQAYDPNDPEKPTRLAFDPAARFFSLPANRYWAGGRLNVIEIYRGWLM